MLTYSSILLPWKWSHDYKICYIMWLIFADLGDGSGGNASITYCNKGKALMFKLLDLTGMGVSKQYLKVKK